jgi:hypothetical protein
MIFTAQPPQLTDLCKIARAVKDYPATTEQLVHAAQDIDCSPDVIEFINLFPQDDESVFESRADFYNRAAELALFICEERLQPQEGTLSPQD